MNPDESDKSSVRHAPMYPDTSEQDCTIGAKYTYCPPMSGRGLGCIEPRSVAAEEQTSDMSLLKPEEVAILCEETSDMIAALRTLGEVLNDVGDDFEEDEHLGK